MGRQVELLLISLAFLFGRIVPWYGARSDTAVHRSGLQIRIELSVGCRVLLLVGDAVRRFEASVWFAGTQSSVIAEQEKGAAHDSNSSL